MAEPRDGDWGGVVPQAKSEWHLKQISCSNCTPDPAVVNNPVGSIYVYVPVGMVHEGGEDTRAPPAP